MNKKNVLTYLFLIVLVIIIPYSSASYFNYQDKKQFFEDIDSNLDECNKRAESDNFPTRICDEIKLNAQDAFRASVNSYSVPTILFLSNIVFILFILLLNMKKQIEELKEKIND